MKLCVFARGMEAHRAGAYLWPFALLSRTWASSGHAVTVLTSAHPEGRTEPVTEAGAVVHYLPGTASEKCDARFWQASAAAFDALHARTGFDLALGRGASAWGLLTRGRSPGAPPLVCHEGTYPAWLHRLEIGARPAARLWAPLKALAEARRDRPTTGCRMRADRVVCVSPALEEAIRRSLWWRPPRTTCIPYGIDIAAFAGPPRATGAGRRVIYVGRLTRAKGAEDLLAILAGLGPGEVTLEAIGAADPSYLDRLRRLADRAGLAGRVSFPGPIPHAALPARLRAADVFLFPSTHPEGLSKTVLEAMAAGLPVVAYALPTLRDLIEDGATGVLVPPRRTDLAAARLRALLGDPAAARHIGAQARKAVAARFAPERAAAAWDGLFEAVVRERAV